MTIKRLMPLILCFAFISCEKEEKTDENQNFEGDYFSNLIKSESVQVIRIYETYENAQDRFDDYDEFSFPGNNYIRVWREINGTEYSRKNYNLERVIWYDIDEIEFDGQDTKALIIEFDEFRQ